MIEEGRYRDIARNLRICSMKVIEDEYHVRLVCPIYRELRTNFYLNIIAVGLLEMNLLNY